MRTTERLDSEGVMVNLSDEVLSEITPQTPEDMIGVADFALQTLQLALTKIIDEAKAGRTASAVSSSQEALRYAGWERARIRSYESTNQVNRGEIR